MGYSYPVQLTQWVLASSSGHAILLRFMDTLTRRLKDVADRNRGDITSPPAVKELRRIGPLSLTGPVAVTVAAKAWLEERVDLRWNALTGRLDAGQSKLVDDVLILPITGFRYVGSSAPLHFFFPPTRPFNTDFHLSTVPAEGGTAIWAPNPSRTPRPASGTGPRVPGAPSIRRSSLANSAVRFLDCARIGRNSRIETRF